MLLWQFTGVTLNVNHAHCPCGNFSLKEGIVRLCLWRGHLRGFRMVSFACYAGVTRVLRDVTRVAHTALRVLRGCYAGVTRCYADDSQVAHTALRVLRGCYAGVTRCFAPVNLCRRLVRLRYGQWDRTTGTRQSDGNPVACQQSAWRPRARVRSS